MRNSIIAVVFAVLCITAPASVYSDQGNAPEASLAPEEIRDIPHPDLSGLEDVVVQQLEQGRLTMESVATNPEAGAKMKALSYGRLGHLYHAYEFYDAAEACYYNAAVYQPDVYRWNYCLAFVLKEKGSFEKALHYFKKARSTQVSEDLVYLVNIRIGECYQGLNRLDDANNAYQVSRAIIPTGTTVLARLGELALARRDYQKAVDYLTLALTTEPGANKLHYPLAMAYRRLGKQDLAKKHLALRGMVGVQPPDPLTSKLESLLRGYRVHVLAGKLAFSAERWAEAATSFEKAVAAKPDEPGAWVNLGATYVKLGRNEQGRISFEKAIELDPENMTARYDLGALCVFMGKHEEAVRHLAEFIKATPNDAMAHYKLGKAYDQAQNPDSAMKQYLRALELDASLADAWLDLSGLLERGMYYYRAILVLETAHERLPKDTRILERLARALCSTPDLNSRDGQRALTLADRLMSEKPDFESARTKAIAYAEIGSCDQAVEWMDRAVSLARETSQSETIVNVLIKNREHFKTAEPCRVPGG